MICQGPQVSVTREGGYHVDGISLTLWMDDVCMGLNRLVSSKQPSFQMFIFFDNFQSLVHELISIKQVYECLIPYGFKFLSIKLLLKLPNLWWR